MKSWIISLPGFRIPQKQKLGKKAPCKNAGKTKSLARLTDEKILELFGKIKKVLEKIGEVSGNNLHSELPNPLIFPATLISSLVITSVLTELHNICLDRYNQKLL